MDIDVHALHDGYLRGVKARGIAIVTGAGLAGLTRRGTVHSGAGTRTASMVMDAAGLAPERPGLYVRASAL